MNNPSYPMNMTYTLNIRFIDRIAAIHLLNNWPLIAIQIECLHGTNFLDPDSDLDCDPYNFPSCKRSNSNAQAHGPIFVEYILAWKKIVLNI